MGDPLKYGRPKTVNVDPDDGRLRHNTNWYATFGVSPVLGWRREHAARVWQAMQGVALVACVTSVLIGKALCMLGERRQQELERDSELMAAVARLERP